MRRSLEISQWMGGGGAIGRGKLFLRGYLITRYIWRSGECINTTIKFVLRCGFPRDPRVFYAQNKHLFEYDDFTTIRNIG
uniref:DUF7808 domain-containing protein n=1 Tax=Meloidogyne incognita TaxID=6306 RepID=A0A914NS54_MELIC